jgi:hypothetical protein
MSPERLTKLNIIRYCGRKAQTDRGGGVGRNGWGDLFLEFVEDRGVFARKMGYPPTPREKLRMVEERELA